MALTFCQRVKAERVKKGGINTLPRGQSGTSTKCGINIKLRDYSLSLICQPDIWGHEAPHHHHTLRGQSGTSKKGGVKINMLLRVRGEWNKQTNVAEGWEQSLQKISKAQQAMHQSTPDESSLKTALCICSGTDFLALWDYRVSAHPVSD